MPQTRFRCVGVEEPVAPSEPDGILRRVSSPPPPPRRPGVSMGSPVTAPTLPAPGVRHVWVRAPGASGDGGPAWVAGVFLRWERSEAGLLGQVAFVVTEGTSSPVLVTQLLTPSLIRAADPGPPPT